MSKQGTNPFKGRVIPKGRIEWALNQTLSISSAARLLRVSYNTFKKYAKLYDLFEQNKNQAGVGVPRRGDTGFSTARLQDIFDGKHPSYPHYKLQDRLLKNGYLAQECSNCGFDEYRRSDMKSPLLLDFLDLISAKSSSKLNPSGSMVVRSLFVSVCLMPVINVNRA